MRAGHRACRAPGVQVTGPAACGHQTPSSRPKGEHEGKGWKVFRDTPPVPLLTNGDTEAQRQWMKWCPLSHLYLAQWAGLGLRILPLEAAQLSISCEIWGKVGVTEAGRSESLAQRRLGG